MISISQPGAPLEELTGARPSVRGAHDRHGAAAARRGTRCPHGAPATSPVRAKGADPSNRAAFKAGSGCSSTRPKALPCRPQPPLVPMRTRPPPQPRHHAKRCRARRVRTFGGDCAQRRSPDGRLPCLAQHAAPSTSAIPPTRPPTCRSCSTRRNRQSTKSCAGRAFPNRSVSDVTTSGTTTKSWSGSGRNPASRSPHATSGHQPPATRRRAGRRFRASDCQAWQGHEARLVRPAGRTRGELRAGVSRQRRNSPRALTTPALCAPSQREPLTGPTTSRRSTAL
jgi:hypothetical protein